MRRDTRGSVQATTALVGALVFVVGSAALFSIGPPLADGGDRPRGFAMLGTYLIAWGGFLMLSFGLSAVSDEESRLSCSRPQRRLFLIAGVGGVLSVVGPLSMLVLSVSTSTPRHIPDIGTNLTIGFWYASSAGALISFGAGILWRCVDAVSD